MGIILDRRGQPFQDPAAILEPDNRFKFQKRPLTIEDARVGRLATSTTTGDKQAPYELVSNEFLSIQQLGIFTSLATNVAITKNSWQGANSSWTVSLNAYGATIAAASSTVTVPFTGWYLLSGSFYYSLSVASNGSAAGGFFLGAVQNQMIIRQFTAFTIIQDYWWSRVYLTAGQTVAPAFWWNSGTTPTLTIIAGIGNTKFSMVYLGRNA